MSVPQSWSAVTKQGVDAKYGTIYLDNGDSAVFDYGWHSDKLYEWDPVIMDSTQIGHVDTANRQEIIFVENSRAIDRDKYKKNNVFWDTIDGKEAKIVLPRRNGIGTTGVYFHRLHSQLYDMRNPVTFSLNGENLKPENERKLLEAIKTLKFPKAD
ncbi:MAG: hypothetical protein EOO10_21465 [Chitinophagaceae bacterium]|nr:MAG: hypothetical protein EOO10_21465 [Chitinophagaceae bacterium]